jgi:hypothetical protein
MTSTTTTITLNADGTFKVGNRDATLKDVIKLARTRRDAANADKKKARAEAKKVREAKAAKRKAERASKVAERAAKLVAELKSLGTDQAVIDELVAKLSA